MSEDSEDGIRIIGGRPVRFGFLNAKWGGAKEKDATKLSRILRYENAFFTGSKLYHYTSLAGLRGIIGAHGFWASDNRFMNDAQELIHGTDLALRVIDYCRKRARSAEFSRVLDKTEKAFQNGPHDGSLVVCFSKARDSLEQWRGYGPEGGVCLELTPDKPGSAPLFYGPDMLPTEVLYDMRVKSRMFLSIIRRFESEYIIDQHVMADHRPEYYESEYVTELTHALLFRVAAMKHPSFKQEAEVRAVIPYSSAERFKGLNFRDGPFGIIPYVCTSDRIGLEGNLPLTEVLVGPSARQDLIALGVRTLLKHSGYSDTKVSLSDVPFRS